MHKFNDVWTSYNLFFSVPFVQDFLKKRYQKLNYSDAEQHSFKNSYPFIYYLEHSKNYYQVAAQSPVSVQPVLLFYGMSQLLKACLLTQNPVYPENTAVLAHGVSTRKRKKQSYDFLDDEVKIQKSGLFSQVGEELFHVKQLEGSKYTMNYLLSCVPELDTLFLNLGTRSFSHLTTIGLLPATSLSIPEQVTRCYHMNHERLYSFLKERSRLSLSLSEDQVRILDPSSRLYNCSPFMYNFQDNTLHAPLEKDSCLYFPEMLAHYLLLYNLSMISRYETEWWYELLHTYSSKDYPFILRFLEVTAQKIPYLISCYLNEHTKKD
ncbi:YaaC family protein [Priestia sp. YIM B13446]|uniref:YaaC family protein n=1 Tax=Priestia TaxID=2800373 RepID=UPI00048C3980|nr:YaaC family protein [Priestia megaterium]KWU62409.1 hypothetical protein AWX17_16130 [Priestia megaterium]MDC7724248.1 YaaC family protein [Priestia megaterium]MDC7772463.1 YaaC family protein [Priestia megaterium]MEB2294891.1 YaaC family protein [Priestia megaterium]MED4050576.1 YaaC family protein [Priestia megaterium]